MKHEVIFSGIGGQGVILAGKLLCTAAAKEGYTVTLAPAYGQEKRGGRTSCQVVISDEIGSPVISEADLILVFDEKSLEDYENKVKKDGYLLINSSMINIEPKRTDIKVVKIPLNDVANEIGNARTANMVALGCIIEITKVVRIQSLENAVLSRVPKGTEELNKRALYEGIQLIKQGKGSIRYEIC